MIKKKLTQQYLATLLSYDPITGLWTYRKDGRPAGRPSYSRAGLQPYIRIYVPLCGDFYAHRLAFLWMTGQFPTKPRYIVDHRDGDRRHNAWDNLRAVTAAENQWNIHARKGIGVTYEADRDKHRAEMRMGDQRFLARFDSQAEAQAQCDAWHQVREQFRGLAEACALTARTSSLVIASK